MIVMITTEQRRALPDADADDGEAKGKLEDGLDEGGVLRRHWTLGLGGLRMPQTRVRTDDYGPEGALGPSNQTHSPDDEIKSDGRDEAIGLSSWL